MVNGAASTTKATKRPKSGSHLNSKYLNSKLNVNFKNDASKKNM